jgi:hypothetical protein
MDRSKLTVMFPQARTSEKWGPIKVDKHMEAHGLAFVVEQLYSLGLAPPGFFMILTGLPGWSRKPSTEGLLIPLTR